MTFNEAKKRINAKDELRRHGSWWNPFRPKRWSLFDKEGRRCNSLPGFSKRRVIQIAENYY